MAFVVWVLLGLLVAFVLRAAFRPARRLPAGVAFALAIAGFFYGATVGGVLWDGSLADFDFPTVLWGTVGSALVTALGAVLWNFDVRRRL